MQFHINLINYSVGHHIETPRGCTHICVGESAVIMIQRKLLWLFEELHPPPSTTPSPVSFLPSARMICSTPHPYLPTNNLLFPLLPSSLSLFPLFFFPTSLPHHSQYWKTTPRRRSVSTVAAAAAATIAHR